MPQLLSPPCSKENSLIFANPLKFAEWLQNLYHVEHSRHRNPINFLVNTVAALIALFEAWVVFRLYPVRIVMAC